jgi:hypothetical protein
LARAGHIEINVNGSLANDAFDETMPCDCEVNWRSFGHEWRDVCARATSQRLQLAIIRDERRDAAAALSFV